MKTAISVSNESAIRSCQHSALKILISEFRISIPLHFKGLLINTCFRIYLLHPIIWATKTLIYYKIQKKLFIGQMTKSSGSFQSDFTQKDTKFSALREKAKLG